MYNKDVEWVAKREPICSREPADKTLNKNYN